MKKTTVISISVILLEICILYSFKEGNEMGQEPEKKDLVDNINMTSGKKTKESVKLTTSLDFNIENKDGSTISDPPPKDKDQWKQKN